MQKNRRWRSEKKWGFRYSWLTGKLLDETGWPW
jgi:hypothetical protein